jgi:hypothetical protein
MGLWNSHIFDRISGRVAGTSYTGYTTGVPLNFSGWTYKRQDTL